MKGIIHLWVARIREALSTIEDVPERYREEVEKELENIDNYNTEV